MDLGRYEVCVITRDVPSLGRTHLDVARAALQGGARLIQFRDKDLSTRGLVEVARELRQVTREFGAQLIVNDRVDVALAVGADGVHVGESDMPVTLVRRLLGAKALIGASVDTPEAALAAEAAGADYLGVGPIYATGSKADAGEAIGLGPLQQIRRATRVPVLAVGGITADNAGAAIRAGAHGVAVISAVSDAADMARATEMLWRAVHAAQV